MLSSMAPSTSVDVLCGFWGDLLKAEVSGATARLATCCLILNKHAYELVHLLLSLAHDLSCTLCYQAILCRMLQGSAHAIPLAPRLPRPARSCLTGNAVTCVQACVAASDTPLPTGLAADGHLRFFSFFFSSQLAPSLLLAGALGSSPSHRQAFQALFFCAVTL